MEGHPSNAGDTAMYPEAPVVQSQLGLEWWEVGTYLYFAKPRLHHTSAASNMIQVMIQCQPLPFAPRVMACVWIFSIKGGSISSCVNAQALFANACVENCQMQISAPMANVSSKGASCLANGQSLEVLYRLVYEPPCFTVRFIIIQSDGGNNFQGNATVPPNSTPQHVATDLSIGVGTTNQYTTELKSLSR